MSYEILLNGVNISILFEKLEKIEKLLDSYLNAQQPTEIKPDFISRQEVATLLKITLPTLHEWTKLGWLKSYKIGNRVLYKPHEVMEAVKTTAINKHKKYTL
ncbi:MAG TPA: helix-turn-helix domain-containing protein [Hanamia sp.]|nr:helix-turn-helix domain-containing protein [Hanamia sp.]